jgi:hypothetical protein
MTYQPNVHAAEADRPSTRTDSVAIAAVGLASADQAELVCLQESDRNLRHADEQTILALAAVRRGTESLPPVSFDNWGVIVSPRWQGRSGTTAFIERYHEIGVRGIGPHAIPNLSLHAAAATVSLCLGARGPVYGAGGGPAHVGDGLLAGLTAQLARTDAGTWLVLTEWDGEIGRSVALALVSDDDMSSSSRLVLKADEPHANWIPATLSGLVDYLANPVNRRWDCPLDGGGELSIMAEDAR